MSDTQQGPEWWQASDGRWYPPDSKPPAKPIWRRSWVIIIAALVALLAIAGALGGGDDGTTDAARPSPTTVAGMPLDEAADGACTEFARYVSEGEKAPGQPRLDAVRAVNKRLATSRHEPIKLQATYLTNAATMNDSAFQLASDGFAKACLDAGWDG